MENYNREKEIQEAINAGKRARQSLEEARSKIGSARNWGLLDLFGGGLIVNLFKHSKIKNASQCLENAKRELYAFKRELGDIRDIENMNIDIGDFLTFADFFFDGLIADFLVQSKIEDAKKQIDSAITQVDNILERLSTQ